jgi:hypothetical protein
MNTFALVPVNLNIGKGDASIRDMYYRYLHENPEAKLAIDELMRIKKDNR